MADTARDTEDARPSSQIFTAEDFYRVTFDGRKIRAYLRLLDPSTMGGAPPAATVLVDTVLADCERRGIQRVDTNAVRSACENPVHGEDLQVAQGAEPVPGRDGQITYHFRTDVDAISFEEDEKTGRVDFRELGLIQNVRPGQVLATASKPTPGRPGVDVFAKPVRPVPGQEARIRRGENVQLSEDGRTLTAVVDGYVQMDHLIISVAPVYIVRGDVNFGVGNIDFNGTVRILGTVLEDFKVAAQGDIIVEGDVERASLRAGGSIFVRGTILGKDNTRIQAGRDLVARFANNATLAAGGDVIVNEQLMNCTVSAGSSIRLEGNARAVMGGHLVARHEVRAGVIGSETGLASTLVEMALDPSFVSRADTLEARVPEIEAVITQRESALAKMLAMREKLGRLTSKQLIEIRSLMEEIQGLREKQNDIADEAAKLRQAHADQMAACIVVERDCYPGTRIVIHDIETIIREPLRRVMFERDDETIVCHSH